MIDLAKKRELPQAEFLAMDAADRSHCADASKDLVVVFGMLRHIPKWREVVRERFRVLTPGGRLFLEEPTMKVSSRTHTAPDQRRLISNRSAFTARLGADNELTRRASLAAENREGRDA
jgi:ubiquinone/menaquinone biosynthesis C-methylase UbiE